MKKWKKILITCIGVYFGIVLFGGLSTMVFGLDKKIGDTTQEKPKPEKWEVFDSGKGFRALTKKCYSSNNSNVEAVLCVGNNAVPGIIFRNAGSNNVLTSLNESGVIYVAITDNDKKHEFMFNKIDNGVFIPLVSSDLDGVDDLNKINKYLILLLMTEGEMTINVPNANGSYNFIIDLSGFNSSSELIG